MIISFASSPEALDQIFKKIAEFCDDNSLSEDVKCNLNVVADEMISNIINYSDSALHNEKVILSITKKNNDIKMRITDFGCKFNPLLRESPDVESSLDDRKIGGLGIYIVRQFSKEIRYQRKQNKNILTIILAIR